VFPSVREGLGIALLEALAMSKACVASRIGGIEDIITDGENGILTDVGDSDSIAHAVLKLMSDDGLREAIGRSGRRTVEERFTLDRMSDDIIKIYKKVLH
jgi:glycosyltransferase involved in cell wall biosynthesis